MRIINASIDLTKIDKSKIKTTEKGQKFYNVTIYVNDQPNQWGQDVSIATSLSKEEREAGEKQVYIGNGKTVKTTEPQRVAQSGGLADMTGFDKELGF